MRTIIHNHYSLLCYTLLLISSSASVALATAVPQNEPQQQQPVHRRTASTNLTPREKDVIINPLCSNQALLDADISGNQFISRAEYVNLLLDLAPSDCPVIDMWLNEQPLQDAFDELSCLCHEFGGIDGQNNCCLQAVNVPMLASFATPDSFYPDEYAAQACALIDQVLVQECPSIITTDEPTMSPTPSPTAAETIASTLNIGLSVMTFDTAAPSKSPSNAPTSEMTESGELVLVEIENGQVTTTVEEEHMPTDDIESDPEEEAFIDGDDDFDGSNDEDATPTMEDQEEPENTDNEIYFPIPNNNNEGNLEETKEEKPLGGILAALLCITLVIALALFAVWGRRRGLMENPWKRSNSQLPTVTTSNTDDIDTPRRSNARRSNSFSSDDEDTDDDEDDGSDIERPKMSHKGRSNKTGVVRAEFLDDLSHWGRRKRRRQERDQRREERQRQSMEQNPPQHQNTITTILSTLEFDLNGATEDGRVLRPNSTRSMVSMRSAGGGASPTSKEEHMGVDIFDDRSDTSSYDGSPLNHRGLATMPMETSIEAWLDQQNLQGKSRITTDGSIVVDDRSVMSAASKRSTASSRRSHGTSPQKQLQRQPNDPMLQDWAAHRHQKKAASSIQKLDYSKFSAPPAGSAPPSPGMTPYDMATSRSYSPQRSVQSSSSFSPSQSPKPTYLLSSLSFSPASSPQRPLKGTTSQSVPASPVDRLVYKETLFLKPVRSNSESSFHRRRDVNAETKDSDSPLYSLHQRISVTKQQPSSNNDKNWNPLHLDLPVEHTHHPNRDHKGIPSQSVPLAPRLSPDSQEFYDSVLRMEPPEDDEDDSMGNAFAFEAARPRNLPPPERYLV